MTRIADDFDAIRRRLAELVNETQEVDHDNASQLSAATARLTDAESVDAG